MQVSPPARFALLLLRTEDPVVDVADALSDLAEKDAATAADTRGQQKQTPKVTLDDIKLLVAAESIDLAAALTTYLALPEIDPNPRPPTYVNTATLRQQLNGARRKRRKQQRKEASTEAWKKFMAQPVLPERMQLADLIVALDDNAGEAARALLVEIARTVPLDIGLWGGIKRVWKRAEDRHDHVMWAALTAAIEQNGRGDVSYGTKRFIAKRAWRYLRDLGRATPELFPHVAVELLRHYDNWSHVLSKISYMREPNPLLATWKLSPEPLLRLLEGAKQDYAAKFAVDQLKKHHEQALKGLAPERLARLVLREPPLQAVHELFLELVEKSPSLPLAKLREAGLHEAALRLLFSPSPKARAWAVEYARAQAGDLDIDRIVELVERGQGDVQKLGLSLFEPIASSSLDPLLLARLLATPAAYDVAAKKLRERAGALDDHARVAFLVERVFQGAPQLKFVQAWNDELGADAAKGPQSAQWRAEVWLRVLEDTTRGDWSHARAAQQSLGALNGGDPVSILDARRLVDLVAKRPNDASVIGSWFNKAARANNLDVERTKGLVFPSKTRGFALAVLGNRKLVKPLDLGLSWLLALTKRADADLHRFAYATLLEHTKPDDFAPAGSQPGAGVDRLFAMATAPAESDNTRSFAQTYLRCHHPILGPLEPQAKQLGLAPQLARDVYTLERVWPSLFDHREDVRRFAAAVARVEWRRWNAQKRLAELCESDDKLVRNVALDAMLKAGDPSADPEVTLRVDELSAEVIFPLTESTKKTVRDTGMELIRRHYKQLGGVERLAWLMQSADREVRLFAVRLLWEKHRPRGTPSTWKPRGGKEVSFDDAGRFADGLAMRGFLRRVMLALPPGAMGPSPDGDDRKVRKHVPASVAKRELVEVVRDVAVIDAAFALMVRPVLFEMTGSLAKGEWQACLAAVAAIDKAHVSAPANVSTVGVAE